MKRVTLKYSELDKRSKILFWVRQGVLLLLLLCLTFVMVLSFVFGSFSSSDSSDSLSVVRAEAASSDPDYVTFTGGTYCGFDYLYVDGLEYTTDDLDGTWRSVSQGAYYYYSEYIMFRGSGLSALSGGTSLSSSTVFVTDSTGCSGDLLTLLDYSDVDSVSLSAYAFSRLFYNCMTLQSVPDLDSVVNNLNSAYAGTSSSPLLYTFYYFCYGCSALTSLPSIPSVTVFFGFTYLFYYAFGLCTSLTDISGMSVVYYDCSANQQYSYMFYGCTSLAMLPTFTCKSYSAFVRQSFLSMFENCTSLRLSSSYVSNDYVCAWTSPYWTSSCNSCDRMFSGTGGSFTGTPSSNTTYYIGFSSSVSQGVSVSGISYFITDWYTTLSQSGLSDSARVSYESLYYYDSTYLSTDLTEDMYLDRYSLAAPSLWYSASGDVSGTSTSSVNFSLIVPFPTGTFEDVINGVPFTNSSFGWYVYPWAWNYYSTGESVGYDSSVTDQTARIYENLISAYTSYTFTSSWGTSDYGFQMSIGTSSDMSYYDYVSFRFYSAPNLTSSTYTSNSAYYIYDFMNDLYNYCQDSVFHSVNGSPLDYTISSYVSFGVISDIDLTDLSLMGSYSTGYSDGYDIGYSDGYDSGVADGTATSWSQPITVLLSAVGDILDVQLFGYFSLGNLLTIAVYLFVALVFLKMFAGG